MVAGAQRAGEDGPRLRRWWSRRNRPMKPLKNKVAVVAGATRGAGRGIARGLGEAGATVYCTGRSVRGSPSPYQRPETIEETAELVTAAGGTGIAVRVDHTAEEEVRRLFAQVEKDRGRLDVLVNSVAGEDPTLAWHEPLAKFDIEQGLALVRQAVLSHLLTARHAVPLMTRRRKGLIVEVTEGDTLMGSSSGWKSILKVFVFLFAQELRKSRVAVVALTPPRLPPLRNHARALRRDRVELARGGQQRPELPGV